MLKALVAMVIGFLALGVAQAQDVRANADIDCTVGAISFRYDCKIRLTDRRTKEPLSGVELTVGADMPSMPMMHNLRPVRATAGTEPGTYHVPLELEMFGDWTLRLDVTGRVRDRIIKTLRFDPDRDATSATVNRKP